MKIILDSDVFVKREFENEEELENVVRQHYATIFGKDIIYIPQKYIKTSGGFGTVPEAIVMDFSTENWYIVETELVKHDFWGHIARQVHLQIVASENPDVKQEIKSIALKMISENESLKKLFMEKGIAEIRIHEVVERILESKPKIVIPIDGVPSDFDEWAGTLSYAVTPLVIEKYVEVKSGKVAYMIRGTPFFGEREEEEEEKKGYKKLPPITEEAFLNICEKPGKLLYQRLKELAKEKNHEWTARTKSFSYYVTSKKGKFCALTLWPTGLTILKESIENRKEIPKEALNKFRNEIIKISDLANKYDNQKMPGISTREGDLTENEIELFIAAFKELLNSIS